MRFLPMLLVAFEACASGQGTVDVATADARGRASANAAAATPLALAVEEYLLTAPPPPVRVRILAAEGAGDDAADLAKAVQNPVSDLISLPLQSNVGFGFGPGNEVQCVTNIQPVIPVSLDEDWNLITRTVLPVVYQPSPATGIPSDFGLGDTTFTAFLSPAKPGKVIWGAGPVVLVPTSTGDTLGAGQWGAGPSGVVLTMRGPWVLGVLASNVWSFEGDVNNFLLQYFVNYNLPDGWYVSSAPILTANWKAPHHDRWTIPFGVGVGKLTRIGRLPVNLQVGAYVNVEHPDAGPDWTLRLQVQLLFPKQSQ